MFPHFSKAVGDRVSSVVDYRSAFAVIGEGISGEKKLGDALIEAWAEAFNNRDDNADIPVMSNSPDPMPEIIEPTPDVSSTDFTDAIMSAFSETQLDYADYMTPAGMDYSII